MNSGSFSDLDFAADAAREAAGNAADGNALGNSHSDLGIFRGLGDFGDLRLLGRLKLLDGLRLLSVSRLLGGARLLSYLQILCVSMLGRRRRRGHLWAHGIVCGLVAVELTPEARGRPALLSVAAIQFAYYSTADAREYDATSDYTANEGAFGGWGGLLLSGGCGG